MLAISGFKKSAALALCWASVSCTGPVFIKPAVSKGPVAAATATPAAHVVAAAPAGPVAASAAIPAAAPLADNQSVLTSSTTPVAPAPAAASEVAVSRLTGSAVYCAIAVLMFVALGLVIFVLRGKPADGE